MPEGLEPGPRTHEIVFVKIEQDDTGLIAVFEYVPDKELVTELAVTVSTPGRDMTKHNMAVQEVTRALHGCSADVTWQVTTGGGE